MEIRMNVNGVDVTITARDAVEVGQILAQLNATSPPRSSSPPTAASGRPAETVQPVVAAAPAATAAVPPELTADDKQKIETALAAIQGNPSAEILGLLARNAKGLWDSEIKESLKDKGVLNLAPHLAHVSKMCTKAGVDVKSILLKRKRPLGKGRFAYNYRLADGIGAMIQAIPEFETQRGIPRFDDEFDPFNPLAGLGLDEK